MTIPIGGLSPQPKTEFNDHDVEPVASPPSNKHLQGGGSALADERTTLLSATASMATLTQIAMNGDDSRAAKIEQLRQEVAAGTYKVDPAEIADAILRNWR
jgi:flagellar biosynthesis anti-sigma factor FlgM